MPPPQGILRFPGVQQILGFSYTLSHGVAPGVAQVSIAPQFGIPAEIGTMTIEFDGDVLEFPDCCLDNANCSYDDSGMIVYLQIIDRRWKWRFGQISGRYNIRKKDGTVDSKTLKTPQELLTLCFEAMGEGGFDVSGCPNLTYPEVDWVYGNPMQEAESIAAELGCRIVLDLDNTVSVQPLGQGNDLPENGVQRSRAFGIDPPNRPDSIGLVGGTTRYQTKFLLEAVGQEPDTLQGNVKTETGEIKPIADLSYSPQIGGENDWGKTIPPLFANVTTGNSSTTKEARAKAQQWVYRAYRINCTADNDIDDLNKSRNKFNIPGCTTSVTELWQVLPLENGLVQTYFEDDVEVAAPPILEGIWWDHNGDAANNAENRTYAEPDGHHGFMVDTARGIVWLQEPRVKFATVDGFFDPANLYLTIGHGVKNHETRQAVRAVYEATLPGQNSGTGPAVIRRDDLVATFIGQYDTTNQSPRDPITNADELQQEADYYISAALDALVPQETSQVEYAGILRINPDGAIQQVSWSGGLDGAKTVASRNTEFDSRVPAWKERYRAVQERGDAAALRKSIRKAAKIIGQFDNHVHWNR